MRTALSSHIILTFSTDFIVPHCHQAGTILTVSTVLIPYIACMAGQARYTTGTKHLLLVLVSK